MAQTVNMGIKGLYTHQDVLSEVPQGALSIAKNIVVDREGIASSRRGFQMHRQTLDLSGGIQQMFHYRDRLFIYSYDDINSPTVGTLYRDSVDGSPLEWVAVGNFAPPDPTSRQVGYRVRGIEAQRNAYITSSEGILKLDSPTTTLSSAGVPKGLGGSVALTGSTGFMSTDTAVAYRVVWGIEDANRNLLLGAPSERLIIINESGGTRDVQLTFSIPAGVTTSHFYQIYRSAESNSATDEPTDELQLVYENNPTSGQIAAKSVTVTDNLPNSLRRTTLYTSPSQQGIAQSNEPPPFAKDMAVFKNHVFYANTRQKHRKTITLIGTGSGSPVSASALQVGDTITIAGVTYTAAAAENVGADEFELASGGTPAQNIDDTARSLIRVINQSASTTEVYAYYLSGFDDLPGQILLEERGTGGDTFYVTSSRGDAFDPILPSSGTAEGSDNEEKQHRVYFSKVSQPEAVPLLNFFDIGSADQPIQRVLALRESIFFFKPDGVYRLVGESAVNFRVLLADNTTTIRGPETAVVHNNQIFMMSDQGVVTVSENGDIAIMSRPIEDELLQITSYSRFPTGAFAVSYESERKYILFMPENADSDADINVVYVYNSITLSWTKWTIRAFLEDLDNSGKYVNCSCVGWGAGIVSPDDDRLYLATDYQDYTFNQVLREEKDYDLSDFIDTTIEVSVDEIDSANNKIYLTSTLTNNVGDFDGDLVGYTIQQSTRSRLIRANEDVATGSPATYRLEIEVDDVLNWDTTTTTFIHLPIENVVAWTPNHAGNPGIIKHFRDVTLFFDVAQFDDIAVYFTTNFAYDPSDVFLVPVDLKSSGVNGAGWGYFPWGQAIWGGSGTSLAQEALRTWVDRQSARAHWITMAVEQAEAKTQFELSGVSLTFSNVSSKFRGAE